MPQILLAYLNTCPDGNRKGNKHQEEWKGNQDPATDTNSFPPVSYKKYKKRALNAKLRSYPRDVHLAQCNHLEPQSPQKLTPSSSLLSPKESLKRPNQTFNFMALLYRKFKKVQKIHFATVKKEGNERYYQSSELWKRNKWMGGVTMSMKLSGGAKSLICVKQITR